MNNLNIIPKCYDPYDIWALPVGISIRDAYYKGTLRGKFGAALISLADLLSPSLLRKISAAQPRHYPIVLSHQVLQLTTENRLSSEQAQSYLDLFQCSVANRPNTSFSSWGLGFSWMSKNGLYGPEVSFITHTPYVMEALVQLRKVPSCHDNATQLFQGTWDFLETLKPMYEDVKALALSYAPISEPRIVVNANSYAAYSYALHATYGHSSVKERALERVEKILCWILRQQQSNNLWSYYADDSPGNFIDCFHSCFILKNLYKINKQFPTTFSYLLPILETSLVSLQQHFFDGHSGLCRRYYKRDFLDGFKWDLYDQAEYLGILIDFSQYNQAVELVSEIEKRFMNGNDLYCKIDITGRRWGKNFLRWGISSYLYHKSRLVRLLNKETKKCAA